MDPSSSPANSLDATDAGTLTLPGRWWSPQQAALDGLFKSATGNQTHDRPGSSPPNIGFSGVEESSRPVSATIFEKRCRHNLRMARNNRPKKSRHQEAPADKPLAKELHPELNATFYTSDPASFLRLRIEALSLMALSQEQLRPVYATERRIGSISIPPTGPPEDDERERYVATEAEMIIHHAAEMVLRMFFAHVEAPDCPWIGMASSTSYSDFKDKVGKAIAGGFNREDVALVFLGGSDPRDAAIATTDEEFEDTVDAVQLLLQYSAHRLLNESFLYNAAKHGLTTVQLDDSTKMTIQTGEEEIELHSGRMHTYLHKPASPNASKEGPKWHLSMTGSLPDQDLAVATAIYHAVQNLWQVARRRYTAQSGQVVLLRTAAVESSIYAPITNSLSVVRTTVMELTKKNPDGSLTGIGLNMIRNFVPSLEISSIGV